MPYELDGEAASVAVPESTVFLSDEQVSNLSNIVPSLDESENYGIDLYIAALYYVQRLILTSE